MMKAATTASKLVLARSGTSARLLHATPATRAASAHSRVASSQALPLAVAPASEQASSSSCNAIHAAALAGTASVLLAYSALQSAADTTSTSNAAQCEGTLVSNKLHAPPQDMRGHYALFNEIGRGGFSIVRLAIDLNTDTLLAAKIFDAKRCTSQDIQDEIAMLQHLGHHKHILSLHDVYTSKNETIMFTDLVQGGELFDFIVDMGSVSETDASRLLRDACKALAYMHDKGVCHRDLKPENLLLTTKSPDADIKIADFGLSRRLETNERVLEEHPNGTIAYWAPEIIKHEPQDFAVDMWAFGVLTYITLTGVHPFDPRGDRSDAEIVRAVAKGSYDVTNPWYEALSPDAKDLITRLLASKPSDRLSAHDALSHAWLAGHTTASTPLADGHADRLSSFQRLQHLRANILAVVVSTQHTKLEALPVTIETSNALATTPTVNLEMFRDTFALFDKDASGFIDANELERVMSALGQRLQRKELDAIMRQADVDGDGLISFLEFVSVMNQRLFRLGELTAADLKSAFDIYDTDHDGFISSTELEYMLHLLGTRKFSRVEIANMLDAADLNHDGQIDYHEFCELMQKSLSGGAGVSASGKKSK